MTHSLRKRWLAALRGGKYRQARGVLKTDDGAFCSLGVALDLTRFKWEGADVSKKLSAYGFARLTRLGINMRDELTLIELNDNHYYTFAEIADWIEANT